MTIVKKTDIFFRFIITSLDIQRFYPPWLCKAILSDQDVKLVFYYHTPEPTIAGHFLFMTSYTLQ